MVDASSVRQGLVDEFVWRTWTVNTAPASLALQLIGIRGLAAALDAIAGALTFVVGGGGADAVPAHGWLKMSEPNEVSPGRPA